MAYLAAHDTRRGPDCTVQSPTGQMRTVKNLGWLIAHKDDVTHLSCERFSDWSGFLVAILADGRVYRCAFGSYAVLIDLIERSRTLRFVTRRTFGVNPEGIRFDDTKPGWTVVQS